MIEGDNLRLPLISIPGLGEGVAIDAIERRNEKKFSSIEDVTTRTKINKTVIEKMILLNAFPGLKEEEDITEIGLFAF